MSLEIVWNRYQKIYPYKCSDRKKEIRSNMKSLYICVDFDGTIVTHEFPKIGYDIVFALETLKELQANGHKIILFTMRADKYLDEAVEYLKEKGIELFGININPTQASWTSSPKAYGNIYIDDAALGCPLIHNVNSRPFVNWVKVREYLREMDVI